MKKTFEIKNPNEVMKNLRAKGEPYLLEQTMFTKKITTDKVIFRYVDGNSDIKRSDLGFIGLVKKHCESLTNIPEVEREFIKYIQPNINLPISYYLKQDLFEIDLTGAYWEFANEEGYLSENIYKRGLTVKKKVRLIALGNLAKRTALINFDGKQFKEIQFRRSEITENIFFHVSQKTDLLMRKLIILAGEQFLFYWCDAIFFKSEAIKKRIENYLESEGIKFKSRKLTKVLRQENKITVWDLDHINLNIDPKTNKLKNPDGKRVFNFKKNNLLTRLKKPRLKNGKRKK